MASDTYHEPIEKLSAQTIDMHRAISSLMEELEAVDWYQQRVDACPDPALQKILAHNRDEEKEHAAMVLEWIRRHDPVFDRVLRTYLFSDGDVTTLEKEAEHGGGDAGGRREGSTGAPPAFTVGALRGR